MISSWLLLLPFLVLHWEKLEGVTTPHEALDVSDLINDQLSNQSLFKFVDLPTNHIICGYLSL